MEEQTVAQDRSEDSIRQAASESVKQDGDIRRRVRDLTLEALKSRHFDRDGVREVVRAVSEGMSVGAESSRAGLRQALVEGFRGMDQALTKSVEAGHAALRQLVATGRGISDHELKQALAGLKKVEEDFVATVSQVAESASERVRPELRELVRQATHAGTETGRQTAHVMSAFARRFAGASLELTLTGMELAGEFAARFAQLAGGVLAGMADALDKTDGRKNGS
jgi:hypothetical protein